MLVTSFFAVAVLLTFDPYTFNLFDLLDFLDLLNLLDLTDPLDPFNLLDHISPLYLYTSASLHL